MPHPRTILLICALTACGLTLFLTTATDKSPHTQNKVKHKAQIPIATKKIAISSPVDKPISIDAGKSETQIKQSTPPIDLASLFNFMGNRFKKSPTVEKHLEDVAGLINTMLKPSDADKIIETYREYLDCEMDLNRIMHNWTLPTNIEDAMAYLDNMESFRIERLGIQTASQLYGDQTQKKKHSLRKSYITEDDSLYAVEKEKLLAELELESPNTDKIEPAPYTKYQEKLKLHQRDLSEMPQEDKQQALISMQREFFSQETIEKIQAAQLSMEQEKEQEIEYGVSAEKIAQNSSMTDAEKTKAISDLQEETFGDQAEAFRRRERIRQNTRQSSDS